MISFLACEFGKASISNLISECFGSEFPEVICKRQLDYIFRYLDTLGAKSIVLEKEYIDKDYLEDFSKFYFKRFNSRGHRCARLHFFSESWTHPDIDVLLAPDSSKLPDFKESYLGYTIIKPLPKKFIGRTCLKIYPSIRNKFTLSRPYEVNLFGIKLKIESVGFQEQDKVVSACATTAIWSSLHAAKWIPLQSIPACSQITTDAINFIPGSNNSFPSKELTNKQILRALDVAGQRHYQHLLSQTSMTEALKFIRCYLSSGLPLILGGEVHELINGKLTKLDNHAIAVTGIRETNTETHLFIHDDRIGPFVRATVVPDESKDKGDPSWRILLQETDDSRVWKESNEYIAPRFLIAVTPKKVGLPVALCINTCDRLIQLHNNAMSKIREQTNKSNPSLLLGSHKNQDGSISYEIILSTVSSFKEQILNSAQEVIDDATTRLLESAHLNFDPLSNRLSLLTASLSKHHWKATFYHESEPAFLVIFDATDIAQGDAVVAVYPLNTRLFAHIIVPVMKLLDETSEVVFGRDDTFLASLIRRLSPKDGGLAQHLDEKFGSPRAPARLKPQEVYGNRVQINRKVVAYYDSVNSSLDEIFPDLVLSPQEYMIWVIDLDGTLLIGKEEKSLGHPTLTGFKPARVGGELKFINQCWAINSKSGRYSRNYHNTEIFLNSALEKFKQIFYISRDYLIIQKD